MKIVAGEGEKRERNVGAVREEGGSGGGRSRGGGEREGRRIGPTYFLNQIFAARG